jgi:hypothetical protein
MKVEASGNNQRCGQQGEDTCFPDWFRNKDEHLRCIWTLVNGQYRQRRGGKLGGECSQGPVGLLKVNLHL